MSPSKWNSGLPVLGLLASLESAALRYSGTFNDHRIADVLTSAPVKEICKSVNIRRRCELM